MTLMASVCSSIEATSFSKSHSTKIKSTMLVIETCNTLGNSLRDLRGQVTCAPQYLLYFIKKVDSVAGIFTQNLSHFPPLDNFLQDMRGQVTCAP